MEISAYGLFDFLVLSTLRDWIQFILRKISLRSLSTLELDWTQYFVNWSV